MQNSPESSPSNKYTPWVLFGLLLAGVVVLILKSDNAPKLETQETTTQSSSEQIQKTQRELSNSAPVIGVTFNGKHRAYPVQMLMRPDQHVLNDLCGEMPLTITYCDIDKCTRVFTDSTPKKRLDINIGGASSVRPGKLILKVGSRLYWQDTGAPLEETNKSSMPFTKVEHVETTWGEWRTLHPDAERYVGNGQFVQNEP